MKTFIATIALIATATTATANADMFAAFDAADNYRIAAEAYLDCAADDLQTLTGVSADQVSMMSDRPYNESIGMLIVEGETETFTRTISNMIKSDRVSLADAKASTANVLACHDQFFN